MGDLKRLAFEQKKSIVLLTVASFVKGAATILQALFFVLIADGVFLQGASFEEILPMLGGLLGAILLRAASGYSIGRTGVGLSTQIKEKLRINLIQSFAADPLQASIQGQSGQKVSLLLDAVDEMDGFFRHYIPQLLQSYIIPVILLAAIFVLHWPTGVIILITAPFIPVFMAIVGKRTKEKADEQMEKLGQFSGTFLDVLQGLTTLKLFGQSDKQKQVIQKSSLGFRDSTMEVLKSAFLSSLMLEYISMLSIGIIALEIGLRLVVFQNITFFTAFFVLILVPDFFTMLKDFGSAFHTARGSIAAANRLALHMEQQPEAVKWGDRQLSLNPPHVSLEGVSFQYGEKTALRDLDLEIPPYSQVAIIGKSGAGKTTLLHMIAGLLNPSKGELTIDGMQRQQVDETSWFDQVSYISQHPYLFSGTIEENIKIGVTRETATDEIIEAAEKAGIAEMVATLEEGFQTPIGEAGRGLSGGEKQRIALARAFLKNPSIVLFDEPTTGLDLKTEQILQTSLAELRKNATVITVAHRLHTIKHADFIVLLNEGKAVALGTHDELLGNSDLYREMISIQQGEGVR
ncbi:thiol reductant ABC exporter subunit CydD [Planococcus salinus]|uniref:Thiol reductant ABC exporter subunit CydD n=1 Tax=Planococcus salinus TaxID=1848460 RepID=A0A3M8P693_9BACL|nr:thiol reductant ABC exporter subunit CydD [Planococcus salinus]RNF39216.1 thiol reductant ABC exporter subunit CydD [Planococcus salinus]